MTGRVLFLCNDTERVERQLNGADRQGVTPDALRDDVSTDEITPMSVLTRFGDRLGRVHYPGFQAGGRDPVGMDSIRNGGFDVTVADNRYGKGSSREHGRDGERPRAASARAARHSRWRRRGKSIRVRRLRDRVIEH